MTPDDDLKKSTMKKPAVTKAAKIEEVKVNTEAAIQTIKQEISQQSETLLERLKKRKLEMNARKQQQQAEAAQQ